MSMIRFGLFSLLIALRLAAAQDFCSLRIRVTDGRGNMPSDIPVLVSESNGRAEVTTTSEGDARFCGLGISGVTITVGRDCKQVVVRNIPLVWGLESVVNVIYDSGPCLIDPLSTAGCQTLLRFVDAAGHPIPRVSFDRPFDRTSKTQTDTFGRAMVTLQRNQKFAAEARAPGFRPEQINFDCSRDETREIVVSMKQLHTPQVQ